MTSRADEDLDRLYGVDPAEFTELRKELVTEAKKRGDRDAARTIGAARRPTAAAWVVNALVRADGTATSRLADIGQHLRAAHAAMDGAKIRELSAAQRKLVDELVRTGFAAADVSRPSAALRDDVVGTLQAAVADPEVAARMGRLQKAERWSGFGEFGAVTAVGPAPKATAKVKVSSPPAPPPAPDERLVDAARDRVETARRDVRTAEQATATAGETLADRAAALATARRRYEKVLETLSAAERALSLADADHAEAEHASQAASKALEAASSTLTNAEEDLRRLAVNDDDGS
ncbi:hypothetical protein [Mycobacterium sp. AT1]|uniref:hypothetical protein n=1 Tax=Mycobacterium sp. AT1 TaxID=1961706 RepID=UPI0009AD573B|nr:hypothetical protein [Mycobacterium sp. AT1]OPX09024.1 hypothetical protein B1790_17500 [Mycobacterium sp. AT1]